MHATAIIPFESGNDLKNGKGLFVAVGTGLRFENLEFYGAKVPDHLKIDGHSFLSQVRGEKCQPREWFYSWYSRDGGSKGAREFAANRRFKLYRTGDFFDLTSDPDEKKPLKVADLRGDAATAATTLQAALDQYKNARPAILLKQGK